MYLDLVNEESIGSVFYIQLSWPSLIQYTCLSSLSSIPTPKSSGEVLPHLEWLQTMIDDTCILHSSGT